MKAKVCIRKKYGFPIYTSVIFEDGSEVSVTVELGDFIDALVEEVGNPTAIMTKAGLKEKLRKAIPYVKEELQKATAEVV